MLFLMLPITAINVMWYFENLFQTVVKSAVVWEHQRRASGREQADGLRGRRAGRFSGSLPGYEGRRPRQPLSVDLRSSNQGRKYL